MTRSLPSSQVTSTKAWVVFTGQADMRWLLWLRPGFRHCYVVLHDGTRWLSIDPLSNIMDVTVHHNVPADFDLPCWLAERGHTIVRAQIARPMREAPWMPFTCVEVVKRLLGIHHRFILTPWQLYRHIQNQTEHLSNYANHQGEHTWEVCLHAQK